MKPLSWSWGSHHCLQFHTQAPLPHIPLSLQSQVTWHMGPGALLIQLSFTAVHPRSHSDLGGTSALNMAPTRSMLLYKPFPPHSASRGRALRCCCKRASFQQLTFFYSQVAGSHQGFAQPELCWPEKGCERGQWTENREASRICVERDIHQPPDWLCFWSHFIL